LGLDVSRKQGAGPLTPGVLPMTSDYTVKHQFGLKALTLPRARYYRKFHYSEMEVADLKEDLFTRALELVSHLTKGSTVQPSEIHLQIIDVFVLKQDL
jgi:hypothetical protein